jgi:pimeloyl-ACP methyl ester carboxylesterase
VLSGSSANPVGLLGTLTGLLGKLALAASGRRLVDRATSWLVEKYVRSRDITPAQTTEIVDTGFDLRPFGEAGLEIAGEDFRAAFGTFSGPALVLNGRWDLVMRLGEDDHARAAPDATVSVIDGAGHVCNLDQPETYTDSVARFVESVADVRVSD